VAARKKQAAGRPCKQRAAAGGAPRRPQPLWICPFGSVVRSPVEQEAEAEEEEAAAAAAAEEEEEEEEEEGDYALAKHWKQLGLT
jgi:hypothetical protein